MRLEVSNCSECPMFMNDEYTECQHPENENISFRFQSKSSWRGDYTKEKHPKCPLNQDTLILIGV